MIINIKYFFRNFVLPEFIEIMRRNISSTYVEVGTTYTAKRIAYLSIGGGNQHRCYYLLYPMN